MLDVSGIVSIALGLEIIVISILILVPSTGP